MVCLVDDCIEQTYSVNVIRRGKPSTINYKRCKPHWVMQLGSYQKKKDRLETKSGYVMLKIDGQWIAEHKHIMQGKLNRPLKSNESVHHINGIRNDNRPINLELWVGNIVSGQRAGDLECPHCGKAYLPNPL